MRVDGVACQLLQLGPNALMAKLDIGTANGVVPGLLLIVFTTHIFDVSMYQ